MSSREENKLYKKDRSTLKIAEKQSDIGQSKYILFHIF